MLLILFPPEQQESMSGGVLGIREQAGQILRLLVKGSEVRIQWPQLDYSRPIVVSLDEALRSVNFREAAYVKGRAKFGKTSASALQCFVDCFEGLYLEGGMPLSRANDSIHVTFEDVNVGRRALVTSCRNWRHRWSRYMRSSMSVPLHWVR